MAMATGPRPNVPGELKEVRLSDIALRLHRRRVVLAVTILLALVGGAALTFFTTPTYDSKLNVIPIEKEDIVKSWLDSRKAATFASETLGARLNGALFPDSWDPVAGAWRDIPPSSDQMATRISEHVQVTGPAPKGKLITLTASFEDAALAHDVASAYASSLVLLRPDLENLTRAELFDQYQASGDEGALEKADTAAKLRTYWIAFDDASLPESPSSPRPALNLGIAGFLGIVGGVGLVFALDWLSQYRAELGSIRPPP